LKMSCFLNLLPPSPHLLFTQLSEQDEARVAQEGRVASQAENRQRRRDVQQKFKGLLTVVLTNNFYNTGTVISQFDRSDGVIEERSYISRNFSHTIFNFGVMCTFMDPHWFHCRSVSSIFVQCGSRSEFRVLMTKN
jgi:hypothetical protein